MPRHSWWEEGPRTSRSGCDEHPVMLPALLSRRAGCDQGPAASATRVALRAARTAAVSATHGRRGRVEPRRVARVAGLRHRRRAHAVPPALLLRRRAAADVLARRADPEVAARLLGLSR